MSTKLNIYVWFFRNGKEGALCLNRILHKNIPVLLGFTTICPVLLVFWSRNSNSQRYNRPIIAELRRKKCKNGWFSGDFPLITAVFVNNILVVAICCQNLALFCLA